MNYFVIVLELWLLLLLSMLVGRRLVDLLPTVIRGSIGFYVSPILGLACLVLIATIYGWTLSFQFNYTLSSVLALVAFSIIYEKKRKSLISEWLQVCVFATICSLPILAPIIYYQGYNPFTDTFTYLAHSQWLQNHAFSEKVTASGSYPYLTQIALYQHSGSRMGASFFLGFVQSLFKLQWSYYAYIVVVSLAFVTGCLAIGGIIRQVIPAKKFIILALALLPCFTMNGFLFGAEYGFFPQTFGLAFAAGLAALFPWLTRFIVSKDCPWSNIVFYIIPISICTAALLFAYNEPFLIFFIALGLFILIVGVTFKNKIRTILFFFSLYLLEVLIIINYEIVRIFRNLLQTLQISKGIAMGWPIFWSPIQFLAHAFGMKSSFNNDIKHLDYLMSMFIFPILFIGLLVLLFRFMQTRSQRNLTITFLFCADLVLLVFFIKLRYFAPNMSVTEIGHTFLQYKIAKYAAPFSLALVGIGLAFLWYKNKNLRLLFSAVYILTITIGLSLQCFWVSNILTKPFIDETKQDKHPFLSLLQLRSAVANIPKNDTIYIALGQEHHKLRQMVAYALYDRKIASDYSDDGYLLNHLPPEDRVMLSNQANFLVRMNTKNDSCNKKTRIVGVFAIYYSPPFNYMILKKK